MTKPFAANRHSARISEYAARCNGDSRMSHFSEFGGPGGPSRNGTQSLRSIDNGCAHHAEQHMFDGTAHHLQSQPMHQMRRYATAYEQAEEEDDPIAGWHWTRKLIRMILFHAHFERLVGFVILANFVCIVLETETRVTASLHTHTSAENSEKEQSDLILGILSLLNLLFLGFYVLECGARMYVQHAHFFWYKWNLFDLFIVTFGIVGELLAVILDADATQKSMDNMQVLRSMRIIRLLRASRLLISFPELYSIVYGLMSCMKTLVWAAGLVLFLLTLWSIIAMEFVQPLTRGLEEEFTRADCHWCATAFDNMAFANLTLFQIMTGDGWSMLCRPLVEKHPLTAIFFVSIIFTMVFGMLNLITAVIVDTAARAREADIISLVYYKDLAKDQVESNFMRMCEELDKDNDGEISLKELRDGVESIPELNAQMKHLGIHDENLQVMFDILDADGDGTVTHKEFAEQLQKIQAQEVQTGIFFIIRHVERMREELDHCLKIQKEALEATARAAPPVRNTSNTPLSSKRGIKKTATSPTFSDSQILQTMDKEPTNLQIPGASPASGSFRVTNQEPSNLPIPDKSPASGSFRVAKQDSAQAATRCHSNHEDSAQAATSGVSSNHEDSAQAATSGVNEGNRSPSHEKLRETAIKEDPSSKATSASAAQNFRRAREEDAGFSVITPPGCSNPDGES